MQQLQEMVSQGNRNLGSSSSSTSNGNNSTGSFESDHEDHSNLIILFPFVVILLGAAAHELPHLIPKRVAIPYTSLLLLVGSFIGLLMKVSMSMIASIALIIFG